MDQAVACFGTRNLQIKYDLKRIINQLVPRRLFLGNRVTVLVIIKRYFNNKYRTHVITSKLFVKSILETVLTCEALALHALNPEFDYPSSLKTTNSCNWCGLIEDYLAIFSMDIKVVANFNRNYPWKYAIKGYTTKLPRSIFPNAILSFLTRF